MLSLQVSKSDYRFIGRVAIILFLSFEKKEVLMLAVTDSTLCNKIHLSEEKEKSSDGQRSKELFKTRTIFLSEGVTSETAKSVVSDLLTLDAKETKTIYLYLNSPGGEVNSGFSIYDTIRFINSEVVIITAGLCASIATIINIAVPKERRLTMPNSRFLIHQPLINGQVYGPASDIEITANEIVKTRAKVNQCLAEACGQDLNRLEEDTLRDYWMSAEEAIDYGLVHRIVRHKSEL